MTFACSGTITLTAELAIVADTSIDGSGQDVTLSGNHTGRVFQVSPGVRLDLTRLTVADAGGEYLGGGIHNDGTLTVSDCSFSGNHAAQGGGVYVRSTSSATLENTLVANSPAGGNCAGNTIADGGGNLSYPDSTCPGITADPLARFPHWS